MHHVQGRSKGILHQMAGEPLPAVALQDSQEGKQDRMTNGFAAAHGQAGLPRARKSARHMPHGAGSQGVTMSASEACSRSRHHACDTFWEQADCLYATI